MKKTFFLVIILFCSILAFGQNEGLSFKNVPKKLSGTVSGSVAFGATMHGYQAGLEFLSFKPVYHQKIGMIFEKGIISLTDYSILQAFYGRERGIYQKNNNFYISGSLKTIMGIEMLTNNILNQKKNKVSFGLGAGIVMEYFISKKLSLIASAEQYYRYNSVIGDFYPVFSASIRYSF